MYPPSGLYCWETPVLGLFDGWPTWLPTNPWLGFELGNREPPPDGVGNGTLGLPEG